MRLWRLASSRYDPLDGEGARLYGGRWNPEGIPGANASSSPALAVLEYLVHTPARLLPSDLIAFEIELPDDPAPEDLVYLPDDWNATDAPSACRQVGRDWAQSKRSLVLSVPSVVVPLERNYLINPLHPAISTVRVAAQHVFRFDA